MNEAEKGDRILSKWSKHDDVDDALINMDVKIEQLQVEHEAGKALWVDAQKRCKAQALRGDKLQAELKQKTEALEEIATSDDMTTWQDIVEIAERWLKENEK